MRRNNGEVIEIRDDRSIEDIEDSIRRFEEKLFHLEPDEPTHFRYDAIKEVN